MNNGVGQQPTGRFSTIAYHLKQPANHFLNPPSATHVNPSGSFCCSQPQQPQQQTINGYIQHSNTQQLLSQSPLRVNCFSNPAHLGTRMVDPSNFEVIRMNHPCNEAEYCYSPHFDCSNLQRTPISPSAINSPFQQGLPDCNRLIQQQNLRTGFLQSSQEPHVEGETGDLGLGSSINSQLSHHVSMQPGGVDIQSSRSTSTNAALTGSYDSSVPVMVQPNRELSRYQRQKTSHSKLKNPYGSSLDALTRVIEIDDSDPARVQFSDRMKQIWIQYSIKLRTLPTITKIPIDLYMLYKLVRERNGYVEVTMKKQWREVANILGIFHIQSAAFGVKRNYTKLGILRYECLYDLNGVDQDQILRDVEASKPPPSNRKRKRPSKSVTMLSGINSENTTRSDQMNEDNTMEDTPPSNSDSESPSISQMSAGLATNNDIQSTTASGCMSACDTGFLFDKQWSSAAGDSCLPQQSTHPEDETRVSSVIPDQTADATLTTVEMTSRNIANDNYDGQTNPSHLGIFTSDNVIKSENVQSKDGKQPVNIPTLSEQISNNDQSSSACAHSYFLPEIPGGNVVASKEQAAGASNEKRGDPEHSIERKFSNPMVYINRVQSPGNTHLVTSSVSRSNTSSPRTTPQSPRAIYTSTLADNTHQSFHHQRLPHPQLLYGYQRPVAHGQKFEGGSWNPNSFSIARPLTIGPLQSHIVPCQGNIQLQSFAAYDRKRSKVVTSSTNSQPTVLIEYPTSNAPAPSVGTENKIYLHPARLNVQDYNNINPIDPSAQTVYINAAGNRYMSTSPHSAYIIPHQNPPLFVSAVRPSGSKGFPVVQFDRHTGGKVLRGEQVCVNYKDPIRMTPPSVVHHLPQVQCAAEALAPSTMDASDPSVIASQQGHAPSMLLSTATAAADLEEDAPTVDMELIKSETAIKVDNPLAGHEVLELRASMAAQQARRRSMKKKLDDCRASIQRIGLQLQTSLPCEISNALGIINTATRGGIEDATSGDDNADAVDVSRYPTIICALAVIMTQALRKSCLHSLTFKGGELPTDSNNRFNNVKTITTADSEDFYDEESTLPCSNSNAMSVDTECKSDLQDYQMNRKNSDKSVTAVDVSTTTCADDVLIADELSHCSFDGNKLVLSTSLAIRNLSFAQKNRHIMARSRLLCATLSEILQVTFALTQNEGSSCEDCNDKLSLLNDNAQSGDLKLSHARSQGQQYRLCVALRENILVTLSNIAEALRLSIFADKARFCRTLFMLCQVHEPMKTEPLICVDMLAIEILTKLLTFNLDNREYLHGQCQQRWANSLFDTLTDWLLAAASLAAIDSKSRYGLAAYRESLLARADMSVSLLLFLLDGSISDGYSQQLKGHIRPKNRLTGFRLLWALLLHLRQELQTSRPGADKCALKCARLMMIIATHLRMVKDKVKAESADVPTRRLAGRRRGIPQSCNDQQHEVVCGTNAVDSNVTRIVDPSSVQDGSSDDKLEIDLPEQQIGLHTATSSPAKAESLFALDDCENHDTFPNAFVKEDAYEMSITPPLNQDDNVLSNGVCEDGLSKQDNQELSSGVISSTSTQVRQSEQHELVVDINNEVGCRIKIEPRSEPSNIIQTARFGTRMELRLKSGLVDTIFMVSCFGGDVNTNSISGRQILQSALSLRRRKGSINSTGTGMCLSSTQQQIAARISTMLVHCLQKLEPNR